MPDNIYPFPRTSPEAQGIASSAVLDFIEALDSLDETHSVMILRHGAVVAEGWWTPYAPQHPHMMYSLSKSFTSTAVGLAVSEGRFSLDDTVVSFFPDDAPAEISEHLAAMRVRHLLSMSTGHAVDTIPPMLERADGRWIRVFFEVPVEHPPGTHFLYNTGATYMLSAILQKTTGQMLLDYLVPRLFEPLGIEHPTWLESPEGIHLGGTGLNIRTEDIARFGQLYLQKGMWQGKQIIPETWVAEATAFQISNSHEEKIDWRQGYGYQFWRCRHNAYRGDGAFGQFCVVMPEQDVVIAITSAIMDMQTTLDDVWEFLLPAIQPDALPEDPSAHGKLKDRLAALRHPPIDGQPDSPTATAVTGRIYRFESNDYAFSTIRLDFDETDETADAACTVTVSWRGEDLVIPCGFGGWLAGRMPMFNERWLIEDAPIVTSGAWTADARFTLVIRYYETPFVQTLTCHFSGDNLMMHSQGNVSFGVVPEPVLLTARAI